LTDAPAPSDRGASPDRLSRVLGAGFNLAIAFGSTVGVGILRLPGAVAASLGDGRLAIMAWAIGGLYAILGAVSVAELAAMTPSAGGFYVFARRAFGVRAGFVVGWNDFVLNCITIAFAALTAVDFLGALAPAAAAHPKATAVGLLVVFVGLNWLGVRVGGVVTNTISSLVGLILVALVVGCFALPAAAPAAAGGHARLAAPASFVALIAAVIASLRSVIVTYDGWYSATYMAEETHDAARTVPRAMIGCAALVTGLYVLINLGLLHAMGVDRLAQSKLPAADVAAMIFPAGAGTFVTLISLFTVLGLINAVVMSAPRILFAIGRDGLLSDRAGRVASDGSPRFALLATGAAAMLLVLSGTLDQLIAAAAVLFVLNYVSAYASAFRLRRSEPGAVRPFRAWGYPWTTGVVLAGSLAFLAGAVADSPRSAGFAAGLIALAVPAWWLSRRARRPAKSASP
jgi:APA family basic amino acid/polyamine antiporter